MEQLKIKHVRLQQLTPTLSILYQMFEGSNIKL